MNDARARAFDCAERILLVAADRDYEALSRAGLVLGLLAVADAVENLGQWPFPAPPLEPPDVPYEQTEAGWKWP